MSDLSFKNQSTNSPGLAFHRIRIRVPVFGAEIDLDLGTDDCGPLEHPRQTEVVGSQQAVQVQAVFHIETGSVIFDLEFDLLRGQLSRNADLFGMRVTQGVLTGFLHDPKQMQFGLGWKSGFVRLKIQVHVQGIFTSLQQVVSQRLDGWFQTIVEHRRAQVTDDFPQVLD